MFQETDCHFRGVLKFSVLFIPFRIGGNQFPSGGKYFRVRGKISGRNGTVSTSGQLGKKRSLNKLSLLMAIFKMKKLKLENLILLKLLSPM